MSGKSVKTFLPSPSSAATFRAAAIAAPDEIPARKPSWLPNVRDVAIASSEGIAHAVEEIGRVEVKELTGLTVELTYSQYQVFSNFLEKEGLQEFDTTFLSDVSTTLFVEESEIKRLGQELTEFYQGKVNYEKSGKKIVEIPI